MDALDKKRATPARGDPAPSAGAKERTLATQAPTAVSEVPTIVQLTVGIDDGHVWHRTTILLKAGESNGRRLSPDSHSMPPGFGFGGCIPCW